jgi:transposase-like protein
MTFDFKFIVDFLQNQKSTMTTDSLKQIYLALQNISEKWAMPIRDRKPALARYMIEFDGRV